METCSRHRDRGTLRRLAFAFALALPIAAPLAARAGETPARVEAYYKISFSAFGKVGSFYFVSENNGPRYSLTGKAKIDTAFFDYSADLSSSGVLAGTRPTPSGHVFSYRQKSLFGKKKHATLNMGFINGRVASRTFVPPHEPSPEVVPVADSHLKDVLDPLSAVMALSLGDIAKPCNRKLAIFDGKQRFDIALVETGKVKLPGNPSVGHVCKVNYTPVSGHKPGKGSGLTRIGKIEVIMRPIKEANIAVPYQVSVSTMAGDITLAAADVKIKMPNETEIALRR